MLKMSLWPKFYMKNDLVPRSRPIFPCCLDVVGMAFKMSVVLSSTASIIAFVKLSKLSKRFDCCEEIVSRRSLAAEIGIK